MASVAPKRALAELTGRPRAELLRGADSSGLRTHPQLQGLITFLRDNLNMVEFQLRLDGKKAQAVWRSTEEPAVDIRRMLFVLTSPQDWFQRVRVANLHFEFALTKAGKKIAGQSLTRNLGGLDMRNMRHPNFDIAGDWLSRPELPHQQRDAKQLVWESTLTLADFNFLEGEFANFILRVDRSMATGP